MNQTCKWCGKFHGVPLDCSPTSYVGMWDRFRGVEQPTDVQTQTRAQELRREAKRQSKGI
jgi:hypothetical protein